MSQGAERSPEIRPGLLLGDLLFAQIMLNLDSGVSNITQLLEATRTNWPPQVGEFSNHQLEGRVEYLRKRGLIEESQLSLTNSGQSLLEETTRFVHTADERRRILGISDPFPVGVRWFLERNLL